MRNIWNEPSEILDQSYKKRSMWKRPLEISDQSYKEKEVCGKNCTRKPKYAESTVKKQRRGESSRGGVPKRLRPNGYGQATTAKRLRPNRCAQTATANNFSLYGIIVLQLFM